jgi:hypothetical protein
MSGINRYFKENHRLFDTEELPNGHLDRFENRLDSLHKKSVNFGFKKYIAVAASVVLLIASINILTIGFNRLNQSSNYLLVNASPEIQEAERFYKNEINAKIKIITHQKNTDNSLLSDIKEMNDYLQNIQEDIEQNPTDSRVIYTVLNSYITQIELLDEIIEQTKSINTQL